MKKIVWMAGICALGLSFFTYGDTHYVDVNSANPVSPYLTWATAATEIQQAVDVAVSNDTVLVTNGVYDTGGAVTPDYICSNRVVITNNITVQSVNGTEQTFIVGEGPNGNNAVRGVYMSAGVLSGFTVANGHTMTSGHYAYDNSGGGVNMRGGNGVVSNCVLTGNSATYGGGGSYYGTLNNCTLTGNSAEYGGGSDGPGTLNNCTLSGNSASRGGGSCHGTLNNCTLIGNSAEYGGGSSGGSTLNNCTLSGNSAFYSGGGSYGGTLNNCTLTGNSAFSGGGSYFGTLNNCIVYFNTALVSGDNWYDSIPDFSYSCTTPDPGSTGNITNDPLLVSASHIASNSPCRSAGSANYATGTDIDGEVWLNPPSMGCDEYHGSGTLSGPIQLSLSGPTNLCAGFAGIYRIEINGCVLDSSVDFGDGYTQQIVGWATHAWDSSGTYDVVLSAWNDDFPGGVFATQKVHVYSVEESAVYVSDFAGSDANDGRSWATAKKTIQAGVDTQNFYGGVVWVTNGVYDTGGSVTPNYTCSNRVVITNNIIVQSVNGSDHTIIVGEEPMGSNAVRGVYMFAGVLSGFTVTNGHTRISGDYTYDRCGGGVNMSGGNGVASNCVLTGNSAGENGGGCYGGTLNNCTLADNSAGNDGGGSYYGTLNNCILTNNSAFDSGGGSRAGTLNNCTLTGNSAVKYGGGSREDVLNNCVLSGNSSSFSGGGSYYGTLNNCTLTGNSAFFFAGGSYYGTLNNCTLTGNSAGNDGGGSYYGTLNNCTLTGNSAGSDGGGSYYSMLNNCIVYFNTAFRSGDNWHDFTPNFSYSCTTPDPGGTGNITNEPMLVSASHISTNSPCVGAGLSSFASGTDIDGEVWRTPPSMGCDEPRSPLSGSLQVSISSSETNVVTGHPLSFSAGIIGEVASNRWTFGDGAWVANGVYGIQHSWLSPGSYSVVLTAYNDDFPSGISVTQAVEVYSAEETAIYVSASTGSDAHDGQSWASAKRTLQEGVDVQRMAGGVVWVTNGVYDMGDTVTPGYACDNRVVITNDILLRSVNGPDATFIQGSEATGGGTGSDAVRGVYMSAGVLSGFTITNGHTRISGDEFYDRSGGGVNLYGGNGVVSNCTLTGNSAGYGAGGSLGGMLNNCTLIGNSSGYGAGGSAYGTLNNCTITGNSSGAGAGGNAYGILNNCTITDNRTGYYGGGNYEGTLNNCTLMNNSADFAGGSYKGILNNCMLTGNSATSGGGGSYYSTLNNCTLADNSAAVRGGGSSWGTLNNCTLTGNSTGGEGGGSYYSTLNNCTLTGNSADDIGGGCYRGTLNNCIVYFNTASRSGDNWHSSAISYSCTMPNPGRTGNVTNDPMLVSASHISTNSPCVGVGSSSFASGTDIDGEVWRTPPSMGCDEPRSPLSGSLQVSISSSETNVVTGHPLSFSAGIIGEVASNRWTFGDGAWVANGVYGIQHSWVSPGSYSVVLTAYNDDFPSGISVTQAVEVYSAEETAIYVSASTGSDAYDGQSWASAKRTLQAGVDVQRLAGGVVWVTNGVYDMGDAVTPGYECNNRVVITNDIVLQSVNGSAVTCIQGSEATGGGNGSDAVRGVYMSAGVLSGFTITNGHTRISGDEFYDRSGGGVNLYGGNGVVNNCTLTGNSTGGKGGGCYRGTLNNCTLKGNSASRGGGSYEGTLNNCTLSGNSAEYGGGSWSYGGTLNNCIVYFNTASSSGDNWYDTASSFSYCCTTPDPGGIGNITNNPQFADAASENYRLLANSPCINAGNNAYALGDTDLDGNPRIIGGIVDIGAFEFENPEALRITPNDAFESSGYEDGLFSPSNKVYTVSNTGGSNLMWRASWGNTWVAVSPSNGTLAAGGSTNVTVSLIAVADSLPPGTNTDMIVFSNLISGATQSRDVQLVVSERVLDHFAWEPIAPTQYIAQAFPVMITAMDASTNVMTSFTSAVNLSGLIDSGTPPLFADDFEDGNHDGWIAGGGSYTRQVTDLTSGGGNYSFTLIGGSSSHHNGISQTFDNSTPERIDFYCRSSSTSKSDGFFVTGKGTSISTDTAVFFYMKSNGTMGIYDGSTYHATAYAANVWYKISFIFDWTAREIDYYVNDIPVQVNIPFRSSSVDVLSKIYLYNYDSSQAWWDEIELTASSILISPTNTGSFVNGVWTGSVSVLEVATNMYLCADDGSGHTGDSNPFNVFALVGDTDSDGLPDWWEELYFNGATNANPNTLCSNGVNTVWQAYIAGLNPTNPASLFLTSVLSSPPSVLSWNAVSGRVYSVWWTSNLLSGFQSLESNIPWTGNTFTDTTYNAEDKGFYKIDVELEE